MEHLDKLNYSGTKTIRVNRVESAFLTDSLS